MPQQGEALPAQQIAQAQQIGQVIPEIVAALEGSMSTEPMAGQIDRQQIDLGPAGRQPIEADGVVQPAVEGQDAVGRSLVPAACRQGQSRHIEALFLHCHGYSAACHRARCSSQPGPASSPSSAATEAVPSGGPAPSFPCTSSPARALTKGWWLTSSRSPRCPASHSTTRCGELPGTSSALSTTATASRGASTAAVSWARR